MVETVKGSSWEDLLDQENTAGFRRNPSYWPAGQEREPILGPGVKYANKSMFRPLYFAVLTLMVELNKTFAWLFNVLAHFYYSWHLSLCALTQHTTFSISCFGDIYLSGIDRYESYAIWFISMIWGLKFDLAHNTWLNTTSSFHSSSIYEIITSVLFGTVYCRVSGKYIYCLWRKDW